MQSARPTGGGQPGARSDMAAKLAEALGLSESKVAAALKTVMPQGGRPNGGQPPAGTNGAAPPSSSSSGTTSNS
jgi:hypothetical protein